MKGIEEMEGRTSGAPIRSKWEYLKGRPGFVHAPARTILRLASWRVRCSMGLPATIALGQWGVRMSLPPQWRGIAKLIFAFRQFYEAELLYLDRALRTGMVFVDVGASLGIYTLAAGRKVGAAGRVLSFEPAASTYALLRRNVELNGLTNVSTRRLALSDRAGSARLHHHYDPSRNSLGKEGTASPGFEEVRTAMLDEMLAEEGIDRVDFLKADVEGAEELVLRGARFALERFRPVVIFEINPGAAASLGLSARGAWDRLQSLGYMFYAADAGGDLLPLSSPPPGGNVVSVPDRQT